MQGLRKAIFICVDDVFEFRIASVSLKYLSVMTTTYCLGFLVLFSVVVRGRSWQQSQAFPGRGKVEDVILV